MTTGIARLNSRTSHLGMVITGSPDKNANGLPVARLNDMVSCPIHGTNPIVSINIVQQTDSLQTANVTATSACGSTIVTGSPDINVA